MAKNSKIEWCHHTFNPWTGCTKIGPGCDHCYAEGWAKRSGIVQWGPGAKRRRTSEANWRQPVKWNTEAARLGVRYRVFCASLADVFEDRPELRESLAKLKDLEVLRDDLAHMIVHDIRGMLTVMIANLEMISAQTSGRVAEDFTWGRERFLDEARALAAIDGNATQPAHQRTQRAAKQRVLADPAGQRRLQRPRRMLAQVKNPGLDDKLLRLAQRVDLGNAETQRPARIAQGTPGSIGDDGRRQCQPDTQDPGEVPHRVAP